MSKRVLDVGQCNPDHSTISSFLSTHFDEVEVVRAHLFSDAIEQLNSGSFDLVLVNRLLDKDHSEGAEIIKAMKADDQLASIPVMIVSNFPEAQTAAVELGAMQGFGKAALLAHEGGPQQVAALLEPILG